MPQSANTSAVSRRRSRPRDDIAPEDLRPAKRKFSDVGTVALLVGNKRTVFHVHINLLSETSTFFDKAFTSEFREKVERKMILPEDHKYTFELFVKWLYTGLLHIPQADTREKDGNWMLRPARVFVLADKYGVELLKRQVCRLLLNTYTQKDCRSRLLPTMDCIQYAYDHTTHHSVLRQFIVDLTTWHTTIFFSRSPDVRDWLITIPEFAVDLTIAMSRMIMQPGKKSPIYDEPSKYYDVVERP